MIKKVRIQEKKKKIEKGKKNLIANRQNQPL